MDNRSFFVTRVNKSTDCSISMSESTYLAMMDGIYWPPSQFEAAFVSAAHLDYN